jgi:hypothetical protein
MEDLDFVTWLERSGQTADAAEPFRNRSFAAARLPRFSGHVRVGPIDPRGGSAEQLPAPPTDRGCNIRRPFKEPPLTAESGGATRAALLAMRAYRGTGSSNPLPSSGESTNFRFLSRRRPLFDRMISLPSRGPWDEKALIGNPPLPMFVEVVGLDVARLARNAVPLLWFDRGVAAGRARWRNDRHRVG